MPDEQLNISAEQQQWERKILQPALAKAPEHAIGASSGVNLDEAGQARVTTISGVPVERLYTEANLPEGIQDTLNLPGNSPYTRGIHPTGYRGKLWTMRQFSGFASAEETN